MYFDTHAHYDDEKYNVDRDNVIETAYDNGVDLMVNVATDIETAKFSIELAKKFQYVYAAVGIHPHNASTEETDMNEIKKLCYRDKVVALGEVGLDYYYDFKEKQIQKDCFARQINIAREVKKPLVIHNRDATKDILDIIKAENAKEVGGVFHCFSGSLETAKIVLDKGFYISFGGAITFKNAKKFVDIVKYVPENRILVETDCPYLTPEPYRGKRNNSGYIKFVVKKLAEIRGKNEVEIADITMSNGKMLFGIKTKI